MYTLPCCDDPQSPVAGKYQPGELFCNRQESLVRLDDRDISDNIVRVEEIGVILLGDMQFEERFEFHCMECTKKKSAGMFPALPR